MCRYPSPPSFTMSSLSKFNFPFDTLAPITGKPINTTLQIIAAPIVHKCSFICPIRPRWWTPRTFGYPPQQRRLYRSRRERFYYSYSSWSPSRCRRYCRRKSPLPSAPTRMPSTALHYTTICARHSPPKS